jgi:short-subunit dehydrogenase
MLVARRETVLQALAIQIAAAHGVKVQIIAADLSDRSAVADLFAGTADQPIGLLVAAVGFGSIGPFLKQDLASEVNMVDVNCRSIVELTRGMAARMAKTGQGGIILFGSLVGFQGVPGAAT